MNRTAAARLIESFTGPASVAGAPAGARGEGSGFESQLAAAWVQFAREMVTAGCRLTRAAVGDSDAVALVIEHPSGRSVVLPCYAGERPIRRLLDLAADCAPSAAAVPQSRLKVSWSARELFVARFGDGPYEFAPRAGAFSGDRYLDIFGGESQTKFDYAIALTDHDRLVERALYEYKYAKSSNGRRLDGNAHERLSFQMLQFVEIAEREPETSLTIIGSSAFTRYANKYHPSFQLQLDRLRSAFGVRISYAADATAYRAAFDRLARFLLGEPSVDRRQAPSALAGAPRAGA